MPAANNVFFRPKPGRFGVNVTSTSAAFGTVGGVTLATSATTSVNIPVPNRKCQLVSLSLVAKTAAAGSGAVTVQAIKRNNQSGSPADVNQTAAKSLTSSFVTSTDAAFNLPITATDAQATFIPPNATYAGDTLRLDLVAAGSVTTQPQAAVVAEWAVLN